jgi:hypothetical protein
MSLFPLHHGPVEKALEVVPPLRVNHGWVRTPDRIVQFVAPKGVSEQRTR